MSTIEKIYYNKAKVSGLSYLNATVAKITFSFEGEFVRITLNKPSAEFVRRMKELY